MTWGCSSLCHTCSCSISLRCLSSSIEVDTSITINFQLSEVAMTLLFSQYFRLGQISRSYSWHEECRRHWGFWHRLDCHVIFVMRPDFGTKVWHVMFEGILWKCLYAFNKSIFPNSRRRLMVSYLRLTKVPRLRRYL